MRAILNALEHVRQLALFRQERLEVVILLLFAHVHGFEVSQALRINLR